ncbi:PiggyBac transposable element-derived protein 4 [Plakobranchus ocellatus]|uniref:PiggyBac transposable element-derived protein 4 n=1 Tax=Plakobranchus ocellatus TaxID=259542 RepID=A0AAV4E118_9GAST|nr:PiggyBac transposable element-derived protein 4 [Plakobranchus ocellatus]
MPADLFQNRQRPGDFDFRWKGQLVATQWFDKREVVTLSTIHQPQVTETIGRYEEDHFLSVCPNTEASDSRGKKAQRRCKVCADRAKAARQTPAERKNKRKLTTTWCRECKVGLCLDCFEIYHTKRDYINN